MTKKEYFELLKKSALNGTFPSIDKRENCKYRLDETAHCLQRCAAGLLIPDEKYQPNMEFVELLRERFTTDVLDMPDGLMMFDLADIQSLHDEIALYEGRWRSDIFIERLEKLPCFNDLLNE